MGQPLRSPDGTATRQKASPQELEASGRQAAAIQGDITQSIDAKRIVQEVIDRFGRIDVMLNSTGAHVDAPAEELKEEDWDHVLGVTLKGAFLIAQAAGKAMITQGRGKIVTISSVRSLLAIRRGYAAYTSAKGGVNMLTKQLATEWARHHINVNAIAPTFIRTASVAQYLTNKEFHDTLVNRIPLGRVGETEDLVRSRPLLLFGCLRFRHRTDPFRERRRHRLPVKRRPIKNKHSA